MTAVTMDELADAIPAKVNAAQRVLLDMARGMANEAGLVAARRELTDARAAIEVKQDAVRVCRDEQRAAKDALAEATAEAEWEIRSLRLPADNTSRSRFWITDDDETEMVEGADGIAVPTPTGEKKRISITAEREKELVGDELRRHAGVREAQRAFDRAVDATQTAVEAVASAERRFKAAIEDLRAARTQLETLSLALAKEATE